MLLKRIDARSLTSLQQRIVKTGGRLIKHAGYNLVVVGRETSAPAAVGPVDGSKEGSSKKIQPQSAHFKVPKAEHHLAHFMHAIVRFIPPDLTIHPKSSVLNARRR